MRSIHRVGACIVVFLFITISYIHVKQIPIPDYLPQKAHDYFHADEVYDADPNTNPSEEPEDIETLLKSPVVSEEVPLETRLEAFLQRPIPTYNESLSINGKACPTQGINYDRNAVHGNAESWASIPNEQILQWRRNIVTNLELRIPSSTSSQGRGIVFAAGDAAAIKRVTTNIHLLQSYNCTLPIEIFHYASELSETEVQSLRDLSTERQNVSVSLIHNMERGTAWKSFQIKALAISQSSFKEILWLDSDSYPLRNPESLFETEEYKETGLLLWPDYTKSHASNPLWRLLGQRCRDEYEGESGQIYIHRGRHEDLVWLIEYFAMNHDTYYDYMGGDRDSFRSAALLLGKSWRGPARANAAAGVVYPNDEAGGGHTMLQADPSGRWMFVHANLIKHTTFARPLWARIHRFGKDWYAKGTTYGVVEENEGLGNGVCVDVISEGGLKTRMFGFEREDGVVQVEEWGIYEELKGWEERWVAAGGGLG